MANRPWVECHYCGEKLTARTVTLDHVIPVIEGGRDHIANTLLCCAYCNQEKGRMPYHRYLYGALRECA